MHLHIKKAFCKARDHFWKKIPNNRSLKNYMVYLSTKVIFYYLSMLFMFVPQNYLFDIKALSEGPPPNERGCRICRKIGHLVNFITFEVTFVNFNKRIISRQEIVPEKEMKLETKKGHAMKGLILFCNVEK